MDDENSHVSVACAHEDGGRTGERGVPAERHLRPGREPSQPEAGARGKGVFITIFWRHHEGRLGQVHLGSDALLRGIVDVSTKQTNCSWVALCS